MAQHILGYLNFELRHSKDLYRSDALRYAADLVAATYHDVCLVPKRVGWSIWRGTV